MVIFKFNCFFLYVLILVYIILNLFFWDFGGLVKFKYGILLNIICFYFIFLNVLIFVLFFIKLVIIVYLLLVLEFLLGIFIFGNVLIGCV